VNRDWDGYERAVLLRHWRTVEFVAGVVAGSDLFDALIIVGSFAKNKADGASDLDLMIPVRSGGFQEAWDARATLQPPGTLYAWDVQPPSEVEWAARKFITSDIVKVEIGITDPDGSGARIAAPFVVLEGDSSSADRYRHVPAPTASDLEEAARQLKEVQLVPEVEQHYGALMAALRASWDGTDTKEEAGR
jgi:hypothetical protein